MTNENKNIYDLLCEIEVDLDEYEKEELTDIEKMKLKKQFIKSNKNINYKKYISVASVAIISLGIIAQTKIGSYAYSALEDIAGVVKIALGVDNKIDEYSSYINQSVTRRGLTLKIENVILDGNELIIHMNRKYDKELKENEYLDMVSDHLYVNGEKMYGSARGYYGKINESRQDFIIGYELPKEYKGDVNVKLRIMDFAIGKDDDLNYSKRLIGPWTFKFKVNGDKLYKDTKNIKLEEKINLDTGATMTLESYRGNIISQKIKLTMTGHKNIENEKNIIDIVLKGRDDLGNKVDFNPIQGVIDSKSQKYIYEYDDTLRMFDENAKKLNLTPYLLILDDSTGDYKKVYKKIGDEFTIDLSK